MCFAVHNGVKMETQIEKTEARWSIFAGRLFRDQNNSKTLLESENTLEIASAATPPSGKMHKEIDNCYLNPTFLVACA